jgi:hypothetical protein
MNAPFSAPDRPGSTDDEPQLRALLGDEARRQPPVSPDLRAGVDRRVRRHRMRVAAVVAPAVALVLGGAVLLAPRATPEATLQTAAGSEEPAAESAAEPAPVVTVTDCGTVELGPERVDPEAAPLDCFIAAFNAGTDATVTVLLHGPDGGTITEQVATAPNKQISITSSGSASIQMPNISFGSGGGIVPADPEGDGSTTNCGDLTWTEGQTAAPDVPPDMVECLVDLTLQGGAGRFSITSHDAAGQTLAVVVEISSDRLVTVSVDGAVTQTLPDLTIPSDLTSHLPPNGFGIPDMGLGGMGETWMFPGGTHGGPADRSEQPGS